MIASSRCCLNLSPPPSTGPSSLPSKTTKIVNWQKEAKSWRNKSILGVSCIMIVLQMDNEIKLGDTVLADELQAGIVIGSKNEKTQMMRWSDKRSCTSWRLNSLETIVPENLPRPAAHRRWETVGFAGNTAPAVKDGISVGNSGNNNGCFSL